MASRNRLPTDIENPYVPLVTSLKEELDGLTYLSPDCCIYRVPDRLRRVNEKAYTPQVVSIGPLHHGREGLERMEEHKRRYLQHFLRQANVSLGDLIGIVKEREKRVRNCYADSIGFSSDNFVKMILVDAAFIIEFLLRFKYPALRDDIDRIYYKPWMIQHVVPDLQLLENQLPFFILDDLFNRAKMAGFSTHPGMLFLNELSHVFFRTQLSFVGADGMQAVPSSKIEHFVDLLRNFYLPSKMLKGGNFENLTVPSVTELHRAGVKFKGSRNNLFEIKFQNGILEIPTQKIIDHSEILFRNILAFEHCHCSENYVTDYIVLMERLVNTPSDLELLVKYGIVEHTMGDSNESSSLIKNLADGVVVDFGDFYFAKLCEDMNTHCRTSWHNWKANLEQNYFNTPWSIISVVAAFVLLVLTVIQTVCSILAL